MQQKIFLKNILFCTEWRNNKSVWDREVGNTDQTYKYMRWIGQISRCNIDV